MGIEIQKVSKSFGRYAALKEVDLSVHDGELLALLGPSGSGKTTLLRIIAGLEEPDSGRIVIENEPLSAERRQQHPVGFVFQHYALFRHMTVFENIAFGLRVRPRKTRPSKQEITEKVEHLLKLVQLDGLAHRRPLQLSGGQRQRVALARALAVEPKVLLLDEPFGALDAKVRNELRRWLRRLHDEIHVTSVFVTHDQEEALEVSDRVVILNEGRIEQIGAPEEVYDSPANPFVFQFLGNVNLFHGRFSDGDGQFDLSSHEDQATVSESAGAVAYVRPHEIDIERERNGSDSIAGVVRYVLPVGPTVKVELERPDGTRVDAEISKERHRQLRLKRGDNVFIKPQKIKVFEDFSI